jgi:hypothetical protein
VGGWMGVKAVLRIAYSNQKLEHNEQSTKQTIASIICFYWFLALL